MVWMVRAPHGEWDAGCMVPSAQVPRATPPGLSLAALVIGNAVASEGWIVQVHISIRRDEGVARQILVEAMNLIAVA